MPRIQPNSAPNPQSQALLAQVKQRPCGTEVDLPVVKINPAAQAA